MDPNDQVTIDIPESFGLDDESMSSRGMTTLKSLDHRLYQLHLPCENVVALGHFGSLKSTIV